MLSVVPILSFRDELELISTLSYNFGSINRTICTFLEEDWRADELRALLEPFNRHAFQFAGDFAHILGMGRTFYTHSNEEYQHPNIPTITTKEQVQILVDPQFQRRAVYLAQQIVSLLESASNLLKEQILPHLPGIEYALREYVEEYCERNRIMEERSQSWIPSIVQDIIWGPNDPTTWDISEVEILPQDFDKGTNNLKKLPDFLNRLQAHFLQLSDPEAVRVAAQSYTGGQDLHQLYRQRLECAALFLEMDNLWDPAILSFPRKAY